MALPELLEHLKSQKDDMLADVGSWSSDSLKDRPAPEEWSAVEILDHLVRTEVAILGAARKGLLKPHRIGVTDILRTRFVQKIFRSDRKVKVPASAARVLPGSDLELPAIAQRWNDSHREISSLLETTSEEQLKKGIFRHPVAGWMGMKEILDFFSVHITHHKYQLARLRNAVQG